MQGRMLPAVAYVGSRALSILRILEVKYLVTRDRRLT